LLTFKNIDLLQIIMIKIFFNYYTVNYCFNFHYYLFTFYFIILNLYFIVKFVILNIEFTILIKKLFQYSLKYEF